ncbi:FAD-dependent oxidoreductase [Furfurilactobacillus siliginis]|uniref:NADH peroxidase n=1 Tax=Furfurilactobacillus siliginis TaxID=348151 RepID=A0A0R2L5B5_9LACO|nr:FAD-dependent oxidoreductase [Furfurilactobacillus siliginis]KRN95109.1 NADH peroxidase [Furfurilactobacillus siliginis]GEK28366.1 NADH peroxidase [Furfurilactobacillus siliginis]
MKIIVIGGSHGGREAVDGLLETKTNDLKIDWFDAASFGPIMGWSEDQLINHKAELAAKDVTIFDQTRIISLDPQKHEVTAQDSTGQQWVDRYDKMVLSLGSQPIVVPVDGHDLANIVTVQGRANLMQLRHLATQETLKKVVVIGAGYIGLNVAEIFSRTGKDVTVIDASDRPFSNNLDTEFTDVLTDAINVSGIHLQMNERLSGFAGVEGNVQTVLTDKGEYTADLVVEVIGNRPNTELVKDVLEIDAQGLITVDAYQQTSNPDIFAVGDATTVLYTPTNKRQRVPLASATAHTARQVAANLVGEANSIQGVQGTSALRCAGYDFATTGLNTVMAAKMNMTVSSVYVTQNKLMDDVPAERNHQIWFKLFYDQASGRVLGAQIMAQTDVTEVINTISLGIQLGVTVRQLADADFFFQPELSRPQSIVNVAAQRALRD